MKILMAIDVGMSWILVCDQFLPLRRTIGGINRGASSLITRHPHVETKGFLLMCTQDEPDPSPLNFLTMGEGARCKFALVCVCVCIHGLLVKQGKGLQRDSRVGVRVGVQLNQRKAVDIFFVPKARCPDTAVNIINWASAGELGQTRASASGANSLNRR